MEIRISDLSALCSLCTFSACALSMNPRVSTKRGICMLETHAY